MGEMTLKTNTGIVIELDKATSSKEEAEKAIRMLVEHANKQEDGFVEELKNLKDDAERRNKKMREYEEIKNLAVKETCKEKTERVRLEKLVQLRDERIEDLTRILTEKKIKIQELEKSNRERAATIVSMQDAIDSLNQDIEALREQCGEMNSESAQEVQPQV